MPLCVSLSFCPSLCLSAYLPVCLSVSLSVDLFFFSLCICSRVYVPPYHDGMTLSLGEGGRELLRKYIKITPSFVQLCCRPTEAPDGTLMPPRAIPLHATSITELLKLAHEHGVWGVAVRIHLEHRRAIPLSRDHLSMREYKKRLSCLRRERNKTKPSLLVGMTQKSRTTGIQ
jgi:hypothetical protein